MPNRQEWIPAMRKRPRQWLMTHKQASDKSTCAPFQVTCFTGKAALKGLRLAQLPTWRGSFKWQIEAKIEALQTAYAKVRVACAKPDG